MQKTLKRLITFILITVLFIAGSIGSYAYDIYDLVADMYGTGGSSSKTIEKGVVEANQGYVVYIVNKYGSPVVDPVFLYKTGGYMSYSEANKIELTTRLGGKEVSVNNYHPIGDVPQIMTIGNGGTATSNYEALKSYLTTNSGDNSKILVKKYWGDSTWADFSNTDNEEYMIFEPVFWHGTHKQIAGTSATTIHLDYSKFEAYKPILLNYLMSNNMTLYSGAKDESSLEQLSTIAGIAGFDIEPGEYDVPISGTSATYEVTGTYCGTVYNGALYEQANTNCFIGVYSYRHNIYPNILKTTKNYSFLNAATKTGTVSNTDIINGGYGIGVLSNKGILEGVEDEGGEEDEEDPYEPLSLYETMNYDNSNTYDISEAIPDTSYVTNKINMASFTGDGNFISTKTQNSSRTWTGKCSYYYEIHDWYYNEDKQEWSYKTTVYTPEEAVAFGNTGLQVRPNGTNKWDIYELKWKYGGASRQDQYGYTPTRIAIETDTYTFTASLDYQYINQTPHIYTWQNATITNGSYDNAYYDKTNSKVPAEVKAVMKLYNKNESTSGNGNPQVITSSEAYPDDIAFQGGSDHFVWSGNIKDTSCCVAILNKGYNHNDETVGFNAKNAVNNNEYSKVQSLAAQIQSNTKSRNDSLVYSDKKAGQQTVLSDTWTTGCTVTAYKGASASGSSYATFAGSDASKTNGYKNVMETTNSRLLASRVSGTQQKQIPSYKDNADYQTGITVNYVNIFDDTSVYTLKAGSVVGSSESIYKHVMREGVLPHHTGTLGGAEADGYPVRTHTPVESPLKIVDSSGNQVNEQTQLISGSSLNTTVDSELLLDKWYYIKWDNEMWTSAVYGETPQGYENIFDKYVSAKYLQFPFTVVYNGTVYKTNADGYTDWIEVIKPSEVTKDWQSGVNKNNYESANHWQMTPFYIPSYATECGAPGEDVWINCKVSAINVGTRLGEKDTKVYMTNISPSATKIDDIDGDYDSSLDQNSMKANYVAICDQKVQLSGWVYDFSIVGTDNLAVYTGEGLSADGLEPVNENVYSMASDKKEMKAGTLNRLGHSIVRYLKDGSLGINDTTLKTLPIRDGSSLKYSEMGDLWRGETFAYTIKTIANLDKQYDSIEITPSYTYVRDDGTVLTNDEICVFEKDNSLDSGTKDEVFNVYDKTNFDLSTKWGHTYTLGDRMFYDSYYSVTNNYHFDNWVGRSVDNENLKKNAVTFADTIDSQEYMNRKLTGYSLSHATISAEGRYISGEYEQLAMNETNQGSSVKKYSYRNYSSAVDEVLFKNSMQQWNGEFSIPKSIRIVDTSGNASFDLFDYLSDLTDTYGGYQISDFEGREGHLIVSFDIVVYKTYCETCGHFCGFNGECSCDSHNLTSKPYLEYDASAGGGLNMWAREGYDNSEYDYGTVAVVDLSRSMSDYYEVGILNIN